MVAVKMARNDLNGTIYHYGPAARAPIPLLSFETKFRLQFSLL